MTYLKEAWYFILNNMTQEEIKKRISVTPTIVCFTEFIVHVAKTGEEEPVSLDEFYEVSNDSKGNVWVSYSTGNDDMPYDGFMVTETVEEVREIVKAAHKAQREAFDKYKIIEL